MVADPIVEKIRKNVIEEVGKIRLLNGFNYDLEAEAVAPVSSPNRKRDGLAIVYQGTETIVSRAIRGSKSRTHYDQPFFIAVHAASDAGQDPDERANRMKADIQQQMMKDRTRNGEAIDTKLGQPQKFAVTQGGMIGWLVRINVEYRVLETDPYTNA